MYLAKSGTQRTAEHERMFVKLGSVVSSGNTHTRIGNTRKLMDLGESIGLRRQPSFKDSSPPKETNIRGLCMSDKATRPSNFGTGRNLGWSFSFLSLCLFFLSGIDSRTLGYREYPSCFGPHINLLSMPRTALQGPFFQSLTLLL